MDLIELEEDTYLNELKESVESGLVPIPELDLFVREGYGALVCGCPEKCKTLEQFLNYRKKDMFFDLRDPKGFFVGEKIYGDYSKDIEEGAELVIGPGCKVLGNTLSKAIYCKNYEEMLMKQNQNNKKR